jgi:hypothetical protein
MAKKSPKKPARSGAAVNVWVKQAVRDALDLYLAEADPKPKINSAMETALREFLAKRGYWPPPADAP